MIHHFLKSIRFDSIFVFFRFDSIQFDPLKKQITIQKFIFKN